MMSHVLVLGTGVALLPRVVAIKGKPLGGIIAQRVLTVHSLEDKHQGSSASNLNKLLG